MGIKVPRKKSRDRDEIILQMCKGKKVLHIGAADWPYAEKKYNGEMGPLLYREIDKVCSEQLGIDLDKESIDFLNSKNDFKKSKIKYFNMDNFSELKYEPDIIVFGEVIEHLMNLETALSNIKKVMSQKTILIISTPNAYSFDAIIGNLLGVEFFHPDHKVIFTYGILQNLLKFNSIKQVNFYFCRIPHNNDLLSSKILSFVGSWVIYPLLPRFYNNLLFIGKKENN